MGAHEPPTNRSFYLSVATSTLRFAIIVALVVGGIVLIDRAFPQGGTSALPNGGGGITSPPSPPSSPSKSPKPQPSPQIAGVLIAVFNGTQVTGLAGETANTLEKKYGYVVKQTPADAPSPVSQTTLYFRSPADKVEAEALAGSFPFKGLDVKITRLPDTATNVDKSVQVAIYLGNDYAASQQK